MPEITEQQVLAALGKVIEPELHRDLVTLNMVKDVSIDGAKVSFSVELTTPACPLRSQIESAARAAVTALPGVEEVDIHMTANVAADSRVRGQLEIGVRNTIAIASGKGGVGKSTLAVNLAIALSQQGTKVGLLDADIYGPNIPMMLGIRGMPPPRDGKITPAEGFGLKVMSMGFLVPADQPIVWRGPMLHSAIRQFLSDVDWGPLDYLVIDMPPGTGDVQLSLAQSVPLTGGVIITTPQDVALADARKGLTTFTKLEVPVLGIVENMSYFICPHCGERTDIFSHGGGRETAEELGVPFLGEVALDTAIRMGGDQGLPIVATDPESPQSKAIVGVAQAIAARVSVINMARQQEGPVRISEIPIPVAAQ